MNDADKTKFAQLMAGLAEDCSAVLSKNGMAMRFEALREYTIEQVSEAVVRVMKDNVYNKMPTTGTIIQAISGAAEGRAELQIMAIRSEISRIGSYGSPKFKDGATQDLVSVRFGWRNICGMSAKEFDHFAREFKSAYVSYEKTSPLQIDCGKSVLKLLDGIGTGGIK